jgi:hypothetical protein
MSTLRSWSLAVLLLLPATSFADAVLDWNEAGLAAVLAARQSPPEGARTMAMLHVAMFNAVNAIERRYATYGFENHPASGASASAAAAAAARAVLVGLFPDQREALEKTYAASLQRLSSERGVEGGVALGELSGRDCLAMRTKDGVGMANVYRPITTAGVYIPTAITASHDWREVKPWVMKSPLQFRPEPPPALTSSTWTRDYNEIKEIGGRNSAKRTPEQSEIARFWTATGVVTWNPIVRSLATSKPRSLVENARLFALANMAASDAFVAVFDAKYAFNFWRPVTAIRNGDIDGNDATSPELAWLAFVETPMHPEYPCAHCISSAAVGAVLESQFGTGRVGPISMTSPTAPGVTRRFERIADYVTEVNNARIWGGIHYRNSTEVGERMGRGIGRLTVESVLQPAH